ncbi:MAG: efflux RND transporter periplasmic adaptor subunit [Candidatus Acidiferrales bacterium]
MSFPRGPIRGCRRGIAIGVLALTAIAAGCSRTPSAATRGDAGNPIAVRVAPVEEQIVKRQVLATGSLFALEESTISAQVDGRIEAIHADVGDRVSQGQALVSLDKQELQFQMERDTAAVRGVRAKLGLGPDDALPQDASKVAFVQRAAAELFDAEQKLRRAKELWEEKLISREQMDEAMATHQGARAAHEVAVQEVDELKAQLQSSESARKLAEKKLADATIRAPFPGAVARRHVSPGEFLRVQSPVMVLVRTDRLRARLAVPERWAGALETGTKVDVRVEAYPNEVFVGRLERINPSVSPETRTFEVEALLDNPGGRLKPGFFVNAALASEVEEKTTVVPSQAVIYRYGTYKVFVVDGNKLTEREIKPGTQEGERVEVLEGVKPGERVAIAREGELYNGAIVRE